jgi:hypothetical protein
MQFQTLKGSKRKIKKPQRYIIDWKGKSRSKLQFRAKEAVFPYWRHDVVFEEFPVAGTRLTLDFYNATRKIAIEVQGTQHTKYNPFFHGKNRLNFIYQIEKDVMKADFCSLNGIVLVEIFEDTFDLEEMIESILEA